MSALATTPALRSHDDFHLQPIFHRYDIDALIGKLLAGRSHQTVGSSAMGASDPVILEYSWADNWSITFLSIVRGGPTDINVQLTFDEIKYLCLAAR